MNFSVSAKEIERTATKTLDGTEAAEQEVKRPGIVSKKMLVIIMVCGGIAFLLWAMLGFPRKFKNPKDSKENRCTLDTILCPKGWHRIYDRCFFESEQQTTWRNGQKNCMAYHGSLLIFSSQNEVDFLSYYLDTSSYWIGLKKHSAGGRWMWTNGDALSDRPSTNRCQREPSDKYMVFSEGLASHTNIYFYVTVIDRGVLGNIFKPTLTPPIGGLKWKRGGERNKKDIVFPAGGPLATLYGTPTIERHCPTSMAICAKCYMSFTVEGNGECAFIFENGINAGNCGEKKLYICIKKGLCP